LCKGTFEQPFPFEFEQDGCDNQKGKDKKDDRQDSISDHWKFHGGKHRSLIGDGISYLRSSDSSSSEDDWAERLLTTLSGMTYQLLS
jgi:hypothetical protein